MRWSERDGGGGSKHPLLCALHARKGPNEVEAGGGAGPLIIPVVTRVTLPLRVPLGARYHRLFAHLPRVVVIHVGMKEVRECF